MCIRDRYVNHKQEFLTFKLKKNLTITIRLRVHGKCRSSYPFKTETKMNCIKSIHWNLNKILTRKGYLPKFVVKKLLERKRCTKNKVIKGNNLLTELVITSITQNKL